MVALITPTKKRIMKVLIEESIRTEREIEVLNQITNMIKYYKNAKNIDKLRPVVYRLLKRTLGNKCEIGLSGSHIWINSEDSENRLFLITF